MNYKLSEYNPIEMIRIAEKMSQDEFAIKLGFPNKAQYTHHMRNFTRQVIDKVKTVYGTDLTMEIINYLKCENRRLDRTNKKLGDQLSGLKKNPKDPEPKDSGNWIQ